MLHETLLALLGCTGDVFIDAPAESASGALPPAEAAGVEGAVATAEARIVVAPDVALDAPEREALNRLARAHGMACAELGFHYRALERFAAAELAAPPDAPGASLYRRAVAAAVDEFLAGYRAAVLRLEQELLAGTVPAGPAALSSALRDYAALLPPLHALAATLAARRLGGAELLTLLHARCASAGAPPLAAAYGRLAWHARHAALGQLTQWSVHGVLDDAHGEFFITEPPPANTTSATADSSSAAASTPEPADAAEEDDGGAAEWHGATSLALQALPPWLELSTAEAALFCGRAVRVLRAPRGALAQHAEQLLPPAATAAAAARLAALAAPAELQRAEVDAAVGALRADTAQRLWTLLVQRAALPAHLRALRDYFLMARGDFWAVFLEEARLPLSLPPRAAGAAASLAAPLAAAAAKSSAADDPLALRLRLRFDAAAAPPAGACLPALDGWDGLQLRYAVDWPLGLLLTPAALAAYGALFQHLFRLRRAQAALGAAWLALQRGGQQQQQAGVTGGGGGGAAAAAALRHRMDALLGAWAAHVAGDVLAPAHAALLARVAEARDWRDAARAHAAFLAAARGGALLDLRSAAKALEALLQLALALAAHVRSGGGGGGGGAQRTAELEAHWRRQAGAFVAVLRGPQAGGAGGAGRAPALRLFLQRCDADGLAPQPAAGFAQPTPRASQPGAPAAAAPPATPTPA